MQQTRQPTGTYLVRAKADATAIGGRCFSVTISRQPPIATIGYQVVTRTRAATAAEAMREARRNVRTARKAGGL